ncbi:MAG: hypothetical protein U0235_21845 [Polyangiaceae bacterium]
MRLKYAADVRTLIWTLLFTPGLAALLYARPNLISSLWWLSCYFALACGVIAHNHNHAPTFESKPLNSWRSRTGSRSSTGIRIFALIPTHNLNHHKFVNKAGDATITWRATPRRTTRSSR